MKTVVFKILELYNEKTKQKVMKSLSGIPGVVSTTVDIENKKLTVTGNIDPTTLANKLGKVCYVEIVTVVTKDSPKKVDNIKKNDKKPFTPHVRNPPYGRKAVNNNNPNVRKAVNNNNPNACTIF